jgi:hypothetical protein
MHGGVAEMVLGRGETRQAGGGFRGVLLLDGEPKGRSGEDVRMQGSVDAGEGAAMLRCAAQGLASVPESLVQSVSTQ